MNILLHPLPATQHFVMVSFSQSYLIRDWKDAWTPTHDKRIDIQNRFQAPSLDAKYLNLTLPNEDAEVHLYCHPAVAYPNPDDPEEWIYDFKWGACCYLSNDPLSLHLPGDPNDLQVALDALPVDFLDSYEDLWDINVNNYISNQSATSPNSSTIAISSSAASGNLLIFNNYNLIPTKI